MIVSSDNNQAVKSALPSGSPRLGSAQRAWGLALLMSVAAHGLVLSLEDQWQIQRPVILKTTYQVSLLPSDAGESVADEIDVQSASANRLPEPDTAPAKHITDSETRVEAKPPQTSPTQSVDLTATEVQTVKMPESSNMRVAQASAERELNTEVQAELAKPMLSMPEPVPAETKALSADAPSALKQTPVEQALAKVALPEHAKQMEEASQEQASPSASFVVGSAANPKPGYPNLARRHGWQGSVVLGVWVAGDGRADDITIVDSSGYSILDHAAWETVRKDWVFGLDSGDDTLHARVYVEVPIAFRLQ